MTLEEALKDELSSIADLSGKIHPLVAPETSKPPFLVYRQSKKTYRQTLSGKTTNYEIQIKLSLVAANYKDLAEISEGIETVLTDMSERAIGTGGPYVQDSKYECGEDAFDANVNWMVRPIVLNLTI